MKQLFKRLGLKDKEMNTFLKMLELGAQPVSVVAKHMGIPRSTMYLVVENLKKAQLIETFERADILYVKAIPVQQMPEVIKSRERELEQTAKLLEEKLPELSRLESKFSITPHVKFHEGKGAVMKMYESILNEKGFYAFFAPALVKKAMPEYHFKIPETIRSKKLKVQELLVAGPDAEEYESKFRSKNHQIRILKKGVHFESDTIICKEKIYMISYGEENIVATEIFNKPLAETQRVIFEELWKTI